MKAYGKVKNKVIVFSSPRARDIFMQKAEGMDIEIAIDDEPSANMRRFFEGALVPAFFYLHPKAQWETFKDAREAIKLEYLPGYTNDFEGKRIRFAKSSGDLSKEKFRNFIDTLVQYLSENFGEHCDPDDYKKWRDSAPMPGEIYPQLQRLKEAWEQGKMSTHRVEMGSISHGKV